MLVKQFKFKRNSDKGGFQWTAESEIERPGFNRGFTAVGKSLSDVKEFAALVRWCERTGRWERLSEMHQPDFEERMQTTVRNGVLMLVRTFKFKRNHDQGGFN